MSQIVGKYVESFYPERTSENKLIEQMVSLDLFTRFEAQAILEKYHVGTATDGNPAFWLFNENMEIKSVKVKNSVFFGLDGIWNLPTILSNEPYSRIGVCSSIEEAFWCNMYMKQTAVWIALPKQSDVDISILHGLEVIAILKHNDTVENTLKREIPYAVIYHNDNLIESLLKTGKPMTYVLPPGFKPSIEQSGLQEFKDQFNSNPNIKNLIDSLNLQLV